MRVGVLNPHSRPFPNPIFTLFSPRFPGLLEMLQMGTFYFNLDFNLTPLGISIQTPFC